MLNSRTEDAGKSLFLVHRVGMLLMIPALIALLTTGCSNADRGEGAPLARVGKASIYRDALDKKMRELNWQFGLPDNGETRKELLNGMIAEELLLQDARARHFDSDPPAQQYRNAIKQRILIDEYSRKHILPRITVSDDELKTLFHQFNTQVEARHLFAQTFAQAESYRERLLHGESFEEIASQVFSDPALRDNGGRLEPFSVDEMDPAFEEAAYDLPLYAISDPIKLKHGYSVLQVLSRTTRPLLTEQQFLEKREQMATFLRSRKRPKEFQQHADSLRKEVLKLQFQPDPLTRLTELFDHVQPSEGPLLAVLKSQLDSEFAEETLVLSMGGGVTVGEAVELLASATDQELNWIGGSNDLESVLAGILVRDHILKTALWERLDHTASYKEGLEEEMDLFVLRRISEEIVATSNVPQDSLLKFYQRNELLFNRPEALRLAGIQLAGDEMAEEIETRLNSGESFSSLAATYSQHAESAARGGDLGLITRSNLSPEVAKVWALEKGEWIGHLPMGDGAVGFFMVMERYPGHQQTFAEAEAEVEREYRKNFGQQILSDHIEELKRQTKIEVKSDLLLAINTAGEGAL